MKEEIGDRFAGGADDTFPRDDNMLIARRA